MTEQEAAELIELATQEIVGDKQELTEADMQKIVWRVAELMTGSEETQ